MYQILFPIPSLQSNKKYRDLLIIGWYRDVKGDVEPFLSFNKEVNTRILK